MTKRRPVIVVSPRLPHRDGLCTVVPLSSVAPHRFVKYVIPLLLNPPLPFPYAQEVAWAKCDMLATVSFARLDLFTSRDDSGKRKFLKPVISKEDLLNVRLGIRFALGMA